MLEPLFLIAVCLGQGPKPGAKPPAAALPAGPFIARQAPPADPKWEVERHSSDPIPNAAFGYRLKVIDLPAAALAVAKKFRFPGYDVAGITDHDEPVFIVSTNQAGGGSEVCLAIFVGSRKVIALGDSLGGREVKALKFEDFNVSGQTLFKVAFDDRANLQAAEGELYVDSKLYTKDFNGVSDWHGATKWYLGDDGVPYGDGPGTYVPTYPNSDSYLISHDDRTTQEISFDALPSRVQMAHLWRDGVNACYSGDKEMYGESYTRMPASTALPWTVEPNAANWIGGVQSYDVLPGSLDEFPFITPLRTEIERTGLSTLLCWGFRSWSARTGEGPVRTHRKHGATPLSFGGRQGSSTPAKTLMTMRRTG